ncbi:MAG: tRNA adenosine(34) deaminase TadA [Clostridia bacterium]|nr:tRNA adenosine(34) deaminase TadA [Clostridia bacterium]
MTQSETDIRYMQAALSLARKAEALGEVPIGAIVVWDDGRIVGEGYNARESEKNALLHAEIMAIDAACKALGGWRLHKATLYVTVEPCVMCAGAIVNARIRRVVYGAKDPRFGAMGSLVDVTKIPFNHTPEVDHGVLEEDCEALMKRFFLSLRAKRMKGSAE